MTTTTAGPAPPTESSILAALEAHGSRITLPRRELAASLARWTGSFSAEEVVAGLPDLGRATVYRALRLFVDAGILCKTALMDGSARYSLDGPRHHHHLVCVSCGGIEEFRHPAVERMLRTMAKQVGGIVGHRLELYHRCQACTGGGRGSVRIHAGGTTLHSHGNFEDGSPHSNTP